MDSEEIEIQFEKTEVSILEDECYKRNRINKIIQGIYDSEQESLVSLDMKDTIETWKLVCFNMFVYTTIFVSFYLNIFPE